MKDETYYRISKLAFKASLKCTFVAAGTSLATLVFRTNTAAASALIVLGGGLFIWNIVNRVKNHA